MASTIEDFLLRRSPFLLDSSSKPCTEKSHFESLHSVAPFQLCLCRAAYICIVKSAELLIVFDCPNYGKIRVAPCNTKKPSHPPFSAFLSFQLQDHVALDSTYPCVLPNAEVPRRLSGLAVWLRFLLVCPLVCRAFCTLMTGWTPLFVAGMTWKSRAVKTLS